MFLGKADIVVAYRIVPQRGIHPLSFIFCNSSVALRLKWKKYISPKYVLHH